MKCTKLAAKLVRQVQMIMLCQITVWSGCLCYRFIAKFEYMNIAESVTSETHVDVVGLVVRVVFVCLVVWYV